MGFHHQNGDLLGYNQILHDLIYDDVRVRPNTLIRLGENCQTKGKIPFPVRGYNLPITGIQWE